MHYLHYYYYYKKKAIQREVLLSYLPSRQSSYEAIGLQMAKRLHTSSRGQLNEEEGSSKTHTSAQTSFLLVQFFVVAAQRTHAPDNAGLMPRPKPDDSHLEM